MIITSSNNKLVKDILESKRKGRKSKNSLLYFEGLRLVEDILQSGAKIEKVIIRERDINKYNNFANKFPSVIFADQLFDEISGTVNSQGIAVVVHKPNLLPREPRGLVLVLDKIQDPGNLGTIIRTALAAGVDSVYLLKGTVDLFNEKVLRSTMGALYKIPIFYDVELEEVISLVKEFNLIPVKASPKGEHVYNQLPEGKYIVFMGNEGSGLSEEIENLKGIDVKIPLYGDIESLNVAVATGIILFGINSKKTFSRN